MDKSKIEHILSDDNMIEEFMLTLLNAIAEDDEPLCDKGRYLLLHCLQDEMADDFFIAICGWSVNNLIDMMHPNS